MRLNLWLALVGSMSLGGCASSAPAKKADSPQPVSPRLVAVMPLSRVGTLESNDVTAFEETVRTLAGDSLREQGFIVLTSDTTLRLLEENGINAATVCDSNCALSAAKEMKSEYFVAGTVSRTEGRLLVLLRLFDLQGKQLSSLTLEGESYRELRDTLQLQSNRLFYPLNGRAAEAAQQVLERRQQGRTRRLRCEQIKVGQQPFVALSGRDANELWLSTRDGEVYRFDGVETSLVRKADKSVNAVAAWGEQHVAVGGPSVMSLWADSADGASSEERRDPELETNALWWDGKTLWAAGVMGRAAKQPRAAIKYWYLENPSYPFRGNLVGGLRETGAFTSIHGAGSTLYAVGGDTGGHGLVRRREGNEWKPVPGLAKDVYNAVWVNADNDVWIAGRERLQHWDGARWSSSSMGADSVACTEPKMCFATSGGKPYGWSGSDWVPIQMEGDTTVSKVFALGPEKVWFIGGREGDARQAHGTILNCKVM